MLKIELVWLSITFLGILCGIKAHCLVAVDKEEWTLTGPPQWESRDALPINNAYKASFVIDEDVIERKIVMGEDREFRSCVLFRRGKSFGRGVKVRLASSSESSASPRSRSSKARCVRDFSTIFDH